MLVFDTNILLEDEGNSSNTPPPNKSFQGARVGFRLKALLKSAGWIHQASGDGDGVFSTTLGNVNDVITHELSGPNGMNNDLAWFVLKHPGSARQLQFQIQGQANNMSWWRIKYSFNAGFTGGTPSEFETSSATDQQFLMGGGTDAAPVFEPWLSYPYGSNKVGSICHMAADNAAPYGFWLAGYPIVGIGTSPRMAAVFDPLVDTDPADPDPFGFYFSRNTHEPWSEEFYQFSGSTPNDQASAHGWFDKGGPNEAWQGFAIAPLSGATDVGPFNPANNKIDRFPMVYMVNAGWSIDYSRSPATGRFATGYKGRSTMMHWVAQKLPYGQVLQVSTPRDAIVIGWASLPWNGTLPRV
jgi:hypothetical protein